VVGETKGMIQTKDGYHFTVCGQGKSIDCICEDSQDRDNWMHDIEAAAGEEAFVCAVESEVLSPDKKPQIQIYQPETGQYFEQSYPSGYLGSFRLHLPPHSSPLSLCLPLEMKSIYLYIYTLSLSLTHTHTHTYTHLSLSLSLSRSQIQTQTQARRHIYICLSVCLSAYVSK